MSAAYIKTFQYILDELFGILVVVWIFHILVRKITETETYKSVNIIEFIDGQYVVKNPISAQNIEAMRENMSEQDQRLFDDFCENYFSGIQTEGSNISMRRIVE